MANCYSNRSDWPHRRRHIDLCNEGMLSFRHYFTRPIHILFSGQWVGTFLSKNVPYDLHCTVFIRSCCSLFAVRLSRYTSASTLVVRYCSKSSRHRYRKMKMKMNIIWYMVLWVHGRGTLGILLFIAGRGRKDMLRSNSKQSGKSLYWILKKKKERLR